MLLADIAHGHTDLADWLFLAAFVLAVVAAVLHYVAKAIPMAFGWAAVAVLALAWMVL